MQLPVSYLQYFSNAKISLAKLKLHLLKIITFAIAK
jgi:hypothetical protein